jgi:SAM-dependent methyltransferase
LEESFGPDSLLLDVATGTARLPVALLAIPFYEGEIVGLDISREMLREAARKCKAYVGRVTFLHHPASPLPFEDETFDAVSCLEALEFMPDRKAALAEMVRVLRPGGFFAVSNRVGMDARLMPGRTDQPEQFEEYLESLGLIEIHTRPWQSYYSLAFARKPGEDGPGRGNQGAWLTAIRCPHCAHHRRGAGWSMGVRTVTTITSYDCGLEELVLVEKEDQLGIIRLGDQGAAILPPDPAGAV